MNRSLRRAVLERLAAVEEMAVRASSHLSARPARAHLKTIMDGWRELLIEHQPDLKGRCPVCSGRLRRRRWPCQIWMTAHEHLVGDGPEPTRPSARKSALFHGPRQVEVIPRQGGAPAAADQTGAPQHSANQTDPAGTGADGVGADQVSGPSVHGSRG
ncbi:MAG: hypothetical protein ACREX8_08880 [Gammaproteobacteria bacterium]